MRRIDPIEIEHSCMEETGILAIETSVNAPNTHKRCISVVLRNVLIELKG